jgi:hypothetical protein
MEHAAQHSSVLIPILVFLVVYAAITFELVNKAAAALTGVGVLVVLHVTTEHQAVEHLDFGEPDQRFRFLYYCICAGRGDIKGKLHRINLAKTALFKII